ncbi:MAG TPA: hypothetical protein VLX92_24220 [Kofleriaceae bacterium]|nr:hypothetical protein [Kofleriaceae bacterium]
MTNLSNDELQDIDGGISQGTYCGIAVGISIGAALVNPLTLFFTVEQAAAVCIADYGTPRS